MSDERDEKPVLYVPDSPNVGAADPDADQDDPKRAAKDRARADDLAAKVAMLSDFGDFALPKGIIAECATILAEVAP